MKKLTQVALGATMALAAPVAFAQTTTPAVPDAGIGGDPVMTSVVLAVAGLGAVVGAWYLMHQGAQA